MIRIPVLIAGGGPVGLTLALCLSKQGIKSIVVNERTATGTHPKLDVVNTRSMEIYRQIGLAHRIRSAGNPVSANQYTAIAASASGPFYRIMSDRHFIYQPAAQAAKQSAACRDGSWPLESMQRIAQMYLEPELLQAAREDDNIDVRFGVRLFGFEQDAHGVTAMIQNSANGSHENVRAQYLIGCDGPGSLVRNFLNIDYDGTRDLVGELFIVHFQSDQLASLYPNREPFWHTWIAQPGFQGLLVSPDASRNDYVLHRPFAPRNGQTIEQVVERAIGRKLDYRIVQSGAWRPQFLVAESFGRNRTFIAGDAAHQYMPTGGLGMNTGVTEAHNLAWKLAACLKGWGGSKLMGSYEAERLPVARRNRDQAKKNAALVFETNFAVTDELLDQTTQGDACRQNLGDVFERKISSLYESMGIEIGYRYRNSPVICTDSEPEPVSDETVYSATTWSGARLPSAALKDGTAVFDLLDPCGFTLLVNGEVNSLAIEPLSAAAASAGCPLRIVHLDEPYHRAIFQRTYVLVRPDQHVCWRADSMPPDCTSLINTLCGV